MFEHFRFTTAGESHGKGLVVIVEGVPAGLPLSAADVAAELARRQGGHGRGGRMQIERDAGEISSGVRLGETLGSPLSIWMPNRDFDNWRVPMSTEPQPGATVEELRRVYLPRPGHADLVGLLKYDREDARDILERSSARETGDVGVAAIEPLPVDINAAAEASPVRCLDLEAGRGMVAAIDAAGAVGDTLGGVFEVVARGVPVGLGSHVSWDRKLDGRLAGALMSIHAMKGVEIGMGFASARVRGSDVHDEIDQEAARRLTGGYRRRRNNAGGTEGGMTTGEPLVARVAMKPLSSLRRPLDSVDLKTGAPAKAERERSDVCAVPAAGIVGEAMVALVLADAMREKFGGDSLAEMRANYDAYLDRINARGG